jgi:pyruvate dehydrogenase E1 component beta subunit
VVLPSDAYDAKGLLISAIRDNNFVLYFEHKKCFERKCEVPEESYTIPIGKAAVKREGTDLTLVAWSFMVVKALEAAAELAKEGISVEVVDLRSVLPLDSETILSSVGKTHNLLIVQEAYAPCSVGSEVAAIVAERGFELLDAPIGRIIPKFSPIPFASTLENYILPQTKEIIEKARSMVQK